MSLADVKYLPETPAHDSEIESINDEAFGPGRFVLAAYKIREGGPHDRGLSFVAIDGETVVASVRMTRILKAPVCRRVGCAHHPPAIRPASVGTAHPAKQK